MKKSQVPTGDPRYRNLTYSILVAILMLLIAYARLRGH